MNYIKDMRKFIGHDTLFTVGCGVIVEQNKCILLQHRTDEDNWCIPGGVMELGETFEETAKRETLEETGLVVHRLELFGIYSGEDCFVQYPNKDKVYSVQVIFKTKDYEGVLRQTGLESKGHRFFRKEDLPENLNPRQKQFILHWVEERNFPVIS
ncbi:NUDIX domain-containing protein [Oceanobacillus piezotolerans]|uniref:NUDIX domain-containing protein n=1 Tax=Oceanobacillus piezotolerans TaxID=2448030 RepID=A0A498DDV1_9BACI|nr:NUDIX hydrolase [Oceanobacillus piezotolerans]RLL48382.1 NUDIX domain-containing protein [Oceanobacillus piezotolerans]